MPYQVDREDDDEDWDHDSEEEWEGEDDDESTIPCPYCRREIHEDAERCPYCEQYISAEDSPPPRKPWWVVLGLILALFIILGWIFG